MRINQLFSFEKGLLQSSKCISGDYDFITASSEWKTHNEYTHNCEALIFAAAASGSLGRTHYVNGKFVSSDLCFIITPKDSINLPVDLKFYHILFNELKDEIVRNTKAGTSKEAIGLGSFGMYELPYFDFDTQIRIKNTFVSLNETKERLSSELNYQLPLFKKLRQQLLQDAVQGKLVKQDPNDEPAGELLKKIKEEKEQLIKEKKLKKDKELPPIKKEEFPFNIPSNWQWCRLGDLGTFRRGPFGSALTKGIFVKEGYKVYEQRNAIYDNHFLGNYYITQEKFSELKAFQVSPKDMIVSCSGATLGRIAEIPIGAKNGIINQALMRITLFESAILNSFFIMLFRSPFIQRNIFDQAWGSAIPNMVGLSEIKKIIIPLPPIEEQKKIAIKLEYLLQTCTDLTECIKMSSNQNEKLLQQVLREALQNH